MIHHFIYATAGRKPCFPDPGETAASTLHKSLRIKILQWRHRWWRRLKRLQRKSLKRERVWRWIFSEWKRWLRYWGKWCWQAARALKDWSSSPAGSLQMNKRNKWTGWFLWWIWLHCISNWKIHPCRWWIEWHPMSAHRGKRIRLWIQLCSALSFLLAVRYTTAVLCIGHDSFSTN